MKNIYIIQRYKSVCSKWNRLLWMLIVGALTFISCTHDVFDSQQNDQRYAIKLDASYPVATRISGNMFADGDKMGVFVVDYADSQAGTLSATGNNADNVLFTFDDATSTWEGASDLYFSDNDTPVDIYGYYPFDSNLSEVENYPFTVQRQQDKTATSDELGGYEASDFLWAKAENISPTSSIITLTYNHLMAGVRVTLQKGTGFESDEAWNEMKKTVLVSNVVPNGTINLATGAVTKGNGSPISITPYLYNGDYRAVVIPQAVEEGNAVICVTVDGVNYALVKDEAMTYTAGKMHQFTITVDRREDTGEFTFSLADEAITAWLDDADFHDGILREYVIVDVQIPGTLQECIVAEGKDCDQIESLKVTGTINHADINFMGQEMAMLSSVNLKEVTIKGETEELDNCITGDSYNIIGFKGNKEISNIIFPDNLRKIGRYAFYGTGLTGNLIIPEGVTEIGYGAFSECSSLAGTLTLSSSLEEIGNGAFYNCKLRGELVLPENLYAIGTDDEDSSHGAFENNNFSGSLILPDNLRIIGIAAFSGTKFTGDLLIPQGVTSIGEGAFQECSFDGNIILPEGLIKIERQAFLNSDFCGELSLPSTLKYIGIRAFSNTKISSVILPDGLNFLGIRAFEGCSRLGGTIEIPEKITSINDQLFSGCTMLEGIVMPETVTYIGADAFADCYGLASVVCNNPEPPYLSKTGFENVARNNVKVEVPSSSVSAYQEADSWKEFGRISAYSGFVCSPSKACALNTSRQQTLDLNADGDWTVEHLPSWCSISQMSGSTRTLLTLTIDALPQGSANRVDSVVFKHAEGGYLTQCTISQYDYEYGEDETITLQTHTKGNGINILFLGDGFDAASIVDGSYLSLVNEQMEYFFGIEPYTTYRDYFDVYVSISLSQETGINTLNTYRDTRFLTIYGGGSCTGTSAKLIPDEDLVFEYAVQNTPLTRDNLSKSLIIMSINSTEYGGATYIMDDGSAISMCSSSESAYPSDTRGIVQHEAGGHGFGKLGEEKISYNKFATNNVKEEIEVAHWYGWYQNLSTSGKMADVPWSHLIFDSRYSDYVDIFEGGYGYTRGIYRSESNSCMNYGIPYYNAISRQAIVERIMDYAGEEFTLEKFFEKDTNKWGSSSQTATRSSVASWNGYVSSGRHKDVTIVKGNSLRILRKGVEEQWKKNRK